jgi:hypothetical protein
MSLNTHLTLLSLLLSDPARDTLQHTSDKWFFWLIASTCLVGFGIALEAPEGTIDFIDWLRCRRQLNWIRSRRGIFSDEDPTHWSKGVTFLGLVLVAMGVVGEGIFEVLVSRADAAIRIYDETAIEEANAKAGEAAGSVQAAKVALGIVEQKFTALEERMNAASSKMDLLEGRVVKREPRAYRLRDRAARDKFQAALAPFKGQRFEVRLCSQADTEMTQFFSVLVTALWKPPISRDSSAGWEMVGDKNPAIHMCFPGMLLMIDRGSSSESQRAAVALHGAIEDAGIEISKGEWQTDSAFSKSQQPSVGPSEPNVILIVIGSHP